MLECENETERAGRSEKVGETHMPLLKGNLLQVGIEDQLKKVKIPGPSALALSAL